VRRIKYKGRYILADGTPRAFTADAYNRSEAAALIERQAREVLGDAFKTARCEGTERSE
jgi:hypothetical protein